MNGHPHRGFTHETIESLTKENPLSLYHISPGLKLDAADATSAQMAFSQQMAMNSGLAIIDESGQTERAWIDRREHGAPTPFYIEF